MQDERGRRTWLSPVFEERLVLGHIDPLLPPGFILELPMGSTRKEAFHLAKVLSEDAQVLLSQRVAWSRSTTTP